MNSDARSLFADDGLLLLSPALCDGPPQPVGFSAGQDCSGGARRV